MNELAYVTILENVSKKLDLQIQKNNTLLEENEYLKHELDSIIMRNDTATNELEYLRQKIVSMKNFIQRSVYREIIGSIYLIGDILDYEEDGNI